jgi:hypothetical protein
MSKLSVVIPSRDETFLIPTIDDIFAHATGEVEVVAVLDSNQWPAGWKEVTDRHPNLHTIHNGGSLGMRASINRGVASAITRGATYIAKSDAHCAFSEGFDEVLKAEMDDDWIVVPRRLRLDPEAWAIAEPEKPPYDYHYLSFPDDPNDWGGPGLNGKPWYERAKQRADILVDEELSSQGSFWAMRAAYFERLELMDESRYGSFWNEFQEIGLKCWLSGGRVMVNKKCHYLHLHKGKKYGRGYRLQESALVTGRNHTMKWIWNDAWDKQTRPFEWLIDHFWPVPTWSENWREVLYAERKPRLVGLGMDGDPGGLTTVRSVRSGDAPAGVLLDTPDVGELPEAVAGSVKADDYAVTGATLQDVDDPEQAKRDAEFPPLRLRSGLRIHKAHYGIGGLEDIDVRERLQSLVVNDSLDIIVNNSTLTPNSNPFRGQKKQLNVTYSYDGGDVVAATRAEKEWLIIGQVSSNRGRASVEGGPSGVKAELKHLTSYSGNRVVDAVVQLSSQPMSATALNDYLIRKFSISPQRLRAPMPIELRDFHRNDLAALFAELGFKRGAEIGVAEGNYSEVLLKANPECELLLVDIWSAYAGNPQNKSNEKHEFAYNETVRKTKNYKHVSIRQGYSMDVVDGIMLGELDFCYIDASHLFDDCVMDIIEWSKRVRSGGIVSGDDYYALDQKRWVGGGVVEAVQAYVNAHQISPWFVFQGHKSVDFMWVKP